MNDGKDACSNSVTQGHVPGTTIAAASSSGSHSTAAAATATATTAAAQKHEHAGSLVPPPPPAHAHNIRFRTDNMVFVANLPFQTPWQLIKDHFRQAGNVRYTDLIADKTGRPKGSALVTMETAEEAANAIRMLNETDFEGRLLIVRKFDDGPRPAIVRREMMPRLTAAQQQRSAAYAAMATAAAAGAATTTTASEAVGMTSNVAPSFAGHYHYGNVGSSGGVDRGVVSGYARAPHAVHAMSGGTGGGGGGDDGSRGHFGMYANAQHHQQQQAHASDVGGGGGGVHDLGVDALPKPRSRQVSEVGRRLFVSNLPFDCTSTALRETFQQVGNVERAEILYLQDGRSRGMGFVVMASEHDARIAIAEFDGIEMAHRAMHVRLDNKHS